MEEAERAEEAEREEKERKEAEEAASANINSTDSTTPAEEVMDDEEPLDYGTAPPPSDPQWKPLEHLVKGMNFKADDEDLVFPPANIGGPQPYNHELSPELRKKDEKAMKKIRSYHLQAVYNAGGVRQVDRIPAELLMSQFARVNQMMGEDLNTSLQELFSMVEESSKTLLEELRAAMGPTVSNLVPYNLQWVTEAHNSHLYISLTKVMVFLDCARWEGCDLLEDQVKSLQPDEEFKKLITALLEQISAFEDRIWELALSEELAEEEVVLHVNLTLTAMRPLVGNYFGGILEGLIGRLRIKIHGDGSPPRSTQEGLEKCSAELLWLSSASPPTLDGCGSWGLWAGYSLEFADKGKGPQVPALSSTTLTNLLDVIDCLWLRAPPLSEKTEPSKEHEDHLESFPVKDAPKPSNLKDIYQKFLNVLGEQPSVWAPLWSQETQLLIITQGIHLFLLDV